MAMGVYRIVCHGNGRSYVGSAVKIERRWVDHRCGLRKGRHHCRHLLRAWQKYGEQDFSFEIIEVVAVASDLLVREQHWLDSCEDLLNGSPTAGSTLGRRHSEETKAKLRKPKPVGFSEKVSLAQKGKPKPPEMQIILADRLRRLTAERIKKPMTQHHRDAISRGKRRRAQLNAEQIASAT